MKLLVCQDGKCVYCTRQMITGRENQHKARYATIDHLTPLAINVDNGEHNLVLACRKCNEVKGNAVAEEFVFGMLWVWICRTYPKLSHWIWVNTPELWAVF